MTSDVVIVAASGAYREYREYDAYIGHPNRPFRNNARWMAFYTSKAIQREVPEILDVRRGVLFSKETIEHLYGTGDPMDRDLADLIQVLVDETTRRLGESFDVVFLTAPADPKTVVLERPVLNTKKDRRGRPTPITMGQYRYVSIEALRAGPRTTSELGL